MNSFDFIVSLVMIEQPMQNIVPLSQALQKENCDLVQASAMAMASTLITMFKEKRESDTFYTEVWNSACVVAEKEEVDISVPLVNKHQTKIANAPADTPEQ